MALVVWGVGLVVDGRLPLLILGTLTGGASYLGLNLLLGGREIPDLMRLLRRNG